MTSSVLMSSTPCRWSALGRTWLGVDTSAASSATTGAEEEEEEEEGAKGDGCGSSPAWRFDCAANRGGASPIEMSSVEKKKKTTEFSQREGETLQSERPAPTFTILHVASMRDVLFFSR